MMRSVKALVFLAVGLIRNCHGQDMIEYALMAGTVAVVVAGFLPPQLMPTVSGIFSKVVSITGLMR
jgi:Flp pilus assembly pilin Flp